MHNTDMAILLTNFCTNLEFTEASWMDVLIPLKMIDGNKQRFYCEWSCYVQSNQSLIIQKE